MYSRTRVAIAVHIRQAPRGVINISRVMLCFSWFFVYLFVFMPLLRMRMHLSLEQTIGAGVLALTISCLLYVISAGLQSTRTWALYATKVLLSIMVVLSLVYMQSLFHLLVPLLLSFTIGYLTKDSVCMMFTR